MTYKVGREEERQRRMTYRPVPPYKLTEFTAESKAGSEQQATEEDRC